jgi:hypothetical protein
MLTVVVIVRQCAVHVVYILCLFVIDGISKHQLCVERSDSVML